MSRAPRDEVLLEALATASDNKVGVVVLVEMRNQDMVYCVRRVRRIAQQQVAKVFGVQAANDLFKDSDNEWHLPLRAGGWLFVFPNFLLRPDLDIRNPAYIYWASEEGVFARVTYESWKRLRGDGHQWRPTASSREGKTVWDIILENENDPDEVGSIERR